MASTELSELIRRAELLIQCEQLYLIARLAEKARAANPSGTVTVTKPLVGEELVALPESLDALPYSPHPDGRTDIAAHHDEILYPKEGRIP